MGFGRFWSRTKAVLAWMAGAALVWAAGCSDGASIRTPAIQAPFFPEGDGRVFADRFFCRVSAVACGHREQDPKCGRQDAPCIRADLSTGSLPPPDPIPLHPFHPQPGHLKRGEAGDRVVW